MADLSKLKAAMSDLEEDAMEGILKDVLNNGIDAQEILAACQDGMNIVGDRFETGEYFVGDLIYAGELMTKAVGILKPKLVANGAGSSGRVLLCTVKGDLHDIGKNIVKAMLEGASFEVVDLGIDVAPEIIVREAKERDIKIIALSAVLTLAVDMMKNTVEAFKSAGMRDKVKIIIGGAAISQGAFEYTGADAWAYSPYKGVQICSDWAKA
jgi:methylmalonyl-CoA mutase cobalamin-binding domain/chain